ncbi:MAG TPA: TonB-dependent receptor, partial [Polyangia bacterium]
MLSSLVVLGVVSSLPRGARAEEPMLPEPVAAPAAASAGAEPEMLLDVDRDIDLANVVTSAAKGVTTVQEAPAIITIITAEDIKARGFKWLDEALATVPGWSDTTVIGNQSPGPLVRGVPQAALLMHDGISMFDPWSNTGAFSRTLPLENIKRLEIVTGPGGVLWGANSFLGIVNVIMKDADDVNGVEVDAGYGDGPGNRSDFRAYGLFGKSFWHGRLKLFQHVSYESFVGTTFELPRLLASSPAPQPGGAAFYGAVAGDEPDRSWLVTVDGKYSLGPVSLYYNVPFGVVHPQLGFSNSIVPKDSFTTFDRYGVLEYKDRFFADRFGLQAKGYYVQFYRQHSIQLFPPSGFFPAFAGPDGTTEVGGLHGDITHHLVQRGGITLDSDLVLPHGIRLLFGGEVFYESVSGSTVSFATPANAALLPLYCPVDVAGKPLPNCPRQFTNDASRIVGAVYLNAQWQVVRRLALDGGVRLQEAFGERPYALQPLGSAALVWNFLPDFHLKANYATGFRPPVFNVTDSPQGGLNYGGSPTLKTETSQSFQGEVNARLLRNVERVRELELRLDYSYTFLDNVIQVRSGQYDNTGKRSIHSVELYSKLYLNGDHFVQLSYTFLDARTTDAGVIRTTPNHWVTVGVSFNLVKRLLDVNANLSVFG